MVNRSQIESRLHELRLELERGYGRLARLEREREQLSETLLRIQGAIQVLDGLCRTEGVAADPAGSDDSTRAARG
ncbi:MAG: hypothetical protein P8103_08245 [Candidatus Thiodiazotropha sp.]